MVVAVAAPAAFLGDPVPTELEPEFADARFEVVVERGGVRVLRLADTDELCPHATLAALNRAGGLVGHGRERQRRGIAPQSFESIELTFFAQENVDHEIDIVEQDPFATPQALDVSRFPPGLGKQASFDVLDDRGDLTVGRSVADDERVGDVGEPAQVESYHVLGFSIACGIHTKQNGIARLGLQRVTPLTYKSWR